MEWLMEILWAWDQQRISGALGGGGGWRLALIRVPEYAQEVNMEQLIIMSFSIQFE